jgi:hypothetical protein
MNIDGYQRRAARFTRPIRQRGCEYAQRVMFEVDRAWDYLLISSASLFRNSLAGTRGSMLTRAPLSMPATSA